MYNITYTESIVVYWKIW